MESDKIDKGIDNNWMKVLFQLISILFILSFAVCLVFYFFIGFENYPKYFPTLPAFYLLNGILFCSSISKTENKDKGISLRQIMKTRLIRMIGSVTLLLTGMFFDRPHILSFIAIFIIYYIVYLLFETKVMMDLNKRKKQISKT